MSSQKHLSPKEFDEFMQKRTTKQLEAHPENEPGFVLGSYLCLFFEDNVQVECAVCGIPLFVRPWVYEISVNRQFPILCFYCSPYQLIKGQATQDLAAVVQHTGEK